MFWLASLVALKIIQKNEAETVTHSLRIILHGMNVAILALANCSF